MTVTPRFLPFHDSLCVFHAFLPAKGKCGFKNRPMYYRKPLDSRKAGAGLFGGSGQRCSPCWEEEPRSRRVVLGCPLAVALCRDEASCLVRGRRGGWGGSGFENTLRRKRLRSRLHRKRAPREGRRGDGEQAPFPLNRGFSATFSVAVSAVSAGGGVTPPSFLRNLPRSFCEVAFSLPLPLPGAPPPLSHPACWSWAG